MSDTALSFERVTRRFGRTTAVDRLDVALEAGTVLGLVGRNGAGKTTSLRLAIGLLYPDAGRVRVLGRDPVTQALEVRTRVSLLSEESHLYPWMTVGELLAFGAARHPRWDAGLARALSDRLDLDRAPAVRDCHGAREPSWRWCWPSPVVRSCCCSTIRRLIVGSTSTWTSAALFGRGCSGRAPTGWPWSNRVRYRWSIRRRAGSGWCSGAERHWPFRDSGL